MRKTILTPAASSKPASNDAWKALDAIASVEITSEDAAFPIEDALSATPTTGWRAASPGIQTVRVIFDAPQHLHRIQLHFNETSAERNQEITVSAEVNGHKQELRRQQWTFSPGGSTEELEDISIDLPQVTALELRIDPDRAHTPADARAIATLQSFKVA